MTCRTLKKTGAGEQENANCFVFQQNEEQSDRDLFVYCLIWFVIVALERIKGKYSQYESEMLHSHNKSVLVAVSIP